MTRPRPEIWWQPWIAMALTALTAVIALRLEGRLWICATDSFALWTSDAWGRQNSQQLFDPYTFTHISHGLLLCAPLVWLLPRWSPGWRLALACGLETVWEIVENSAFTIDRYRDTTAAIGYTGDTVINALGDILACGIGFVVADKLGWRWALAIFLLMEVMLALWIRDNLILNVVMLLWPIEGIKAWQAGHI